MLKVHLMNAFELIWFFNDKNLEVFQLEKRMEIKFVQKSVLEGLYRGEIIFYVIS